MFDLDEELKKLPAKPGVYFMFDKKDSVIYVGKAVSLKSRVRQYFQASRNVSPKIEKMIGQIDHFEYIVTNTEVEALVLENNLIKEYNPKYNTKLKDGKAYPFVRATIQEEFPRLLFARQQKKDKSKYFGPFTSAEAVRDTLELVRKLYHIRSCNRNLPKDIGKERPCLYHHIGQCKAPCQGRIAKEDYKEAFLQAMDFLNGNHSGVKKMLEGKMKEASERLAFEEAAQYRDLIGSVEHITKKQRVNTKNIEDKDVVAMAREKDEAVVQVFFVRDGRLIGREHHYLTQAEWEEDGAVLNAFVKQFYSGTPYIPREILLPFDIPEEELVRQWLTQKCGQGVSIKVPKKGEKEKLVGLAAKNAALVLAQDREKLKKQEGKTLRAWEQLASWLGLPDLARVESFDISNVNGFQSVGSMVVFEMGKPKKSDYRKFKIRSVSGPDDYASMKEVLTRRFVHGLKERKEMEGEGMAEGLGSFNRFPDAILMDGGKGQVNVAEQVLKELGLAIAVCGMVKDDAHKTRGLYYRNEEITMDKRGEGFRLISRIQDETHRFAIEYHRSLRGKKQVHSVLDDIPGVGSARRKELMRSFPSLEAIQNASVEELAALSTMNRKAAEQVYGFFHG